MVGGNLWSKFHLEELTRCGVVFPSLSLKIPKRRFHRSLCIGGKLSLHSEASKRQNCVQPLEGIAYVLYCEQMRFSVQFMHYKSCIVKLCITQYNFICRNMLPQPIHTLLVLLQTGGK